MNPQTSPHPQACARCWQKLKETHFCVIIPPRAQFFVQEDGSILCSSCYHETEPELTRKQRDEIPVNHPAYRKK